MKSLRWLLIAVTILVLSACDTQTSNKTLDIPNVVGKNLHLARKTLKDLGFQNIKSHDLTDKSRNQIISRDWKICSQKPSAKSHTKDDIKIDLGVVKTDESCPTAHNAHATKKNDAAGLSVCSGFREISLMVDGESPTPSQSQVVSWIKEIGEIAKDSTNPAIRANATAMVKDANAAAQAFVTSDPNKAEDSLAEICNSTYPLRKYPPIKTSPIKPK